MFVSHCTISLQILSNLPRLLTHTADSVTEISEACGFGTISYLGKMFHEKTGVTPSEYRRQD